MAQHRIPRDSILTYLPLVYFLPEDIIVKCPTLYALPRSLKEISLNQQLIDVIKSDRFLDETMNAVAIMAFPHFGFGGWKEHYTGYCPVWKFSYLLSVWAELLEKEIGWNLQALMRISSSGSIPFFDPDYINSVMERVVKRGIKEHNLQPILDVVRQMPCEEDFEPWDTNVRKDFLRKWYHTRSKLIQMVSLDACIADKNSDIHDMTANSSGFTEVIEANDYVERFKATLSEKDMEILALRVEGYTYEQIAKKLGYKNHSGVIKRIKSIVNKFEKYRQENE